MRTIRPRQNGLAPRWPGSDNMDIVLATQAEGEPEIFASLQGEGASIGVPVAFIRLSRCNLACNWCDTPYTWHFEGDDRPHRGGETYARKSNQIKLSIEDAAKRIKALGQNRLVITGGEPLLQSAALIQLAEMLGNMAIEIETNGTIIPPPALSERIAQFNISPKLGHSGNSADLALNGAALAEFARDQRAFFKFVIAQPADVTEVTALQNRYQIPSSRIFLMAEGTTSESLRSRHQWLVPLCMQNGLRFSDRLHIHLFGDTRGT